MHSLLFFYSANASVDVSTWREASFFGRHKITCGGCVEENEQRFACKDAQTYDE
jgi:hypothetical protein